MDLIEEILTSNGFNLTKEILTSRYKFFEETQPPKSLKDYKYFSNDFIPNNWREIYTTLSNVPKIIK